MYNTWKKILALCLALLMVLSCFAACSNNGGQTETTAPVATESPEEAKVLKVLTLGHSLALDAGRMLNLVAHAEGYEHMVIGTLYYAGCPLNKHVEFLTNNSAEYSLHISSTETPDEPPEKMENVTMLNAIKYDQWDIVVMQGGVFELADDATYKAGYIQTIQKHVNDNKLNPTVQFVWNMTWVPPVDDDLRATYTSEPNIYIKNYEKFNNDRTTLYNLVTECVKNNILTDDTFVDMIPSGTVFENALSSYLTEKDIHRDYAHATDLTRLMTAYTWYCVLTGVEQLTEIKVDSVPRKFLVSTLGSGDWTLTDSQKAIILESVNNALKNPLQMTQSQLTEAPADYIPVTDVK